MNRDWNAFPASVISSAESSEDSVARLNFFIVLNFTAVCWIMKTQLGVPLMKQTINKKKNNKHWKGLLLSELLDFE